MLLTQDEGEKVPEEVEEPEEAEPELEVAEISQVIEVSLNSVAGLTTPRTMKLKGVIGEQELVCLIDPGAPHNFIANKLVTKLAIPVTKTEAYGVRIGSDDIVKEAGSIEG